MCEWLTADTICSINFTPIHALDGTITPQGCAFERHHSGAIDLAKHDYRLMINGLVDQPLVFTYEDLERFPRITASIFCECAANTGMEWAGAQLNGAQFTHGMIHNMEYTGVPLRTLLEEAGVKPEGKWVYVEGADASSNGRSIPMEKALDDVLVAFKANGEALRKEHGYPVRLVVPGWEGNMWVKWLRRIEVMEGPVESREETSKYTDTLADGTVAQMDLGDGRQIRRHLAQPAGPDHPRARAAGHHRAGMVGPRRDHPRRCLQGWRQDLGNRAAGQARRADGADPLLPRHHWDGSEMLLQSRAMDETGYVQPTKTSCARCAARTRSITTTASRPGGSRKPERPRMSKYPNLLVIGTALARHIATPVWPKSWALAAPPCPKKSPPGTSMCRPMAPACRAGRARSRTAR